MILWKTMTLAIGTVTILAFEPQQSNLLVTNVTFAVIRLLWFNWWLWHFQLLDLIFNLFVFAMLSGLPKQYL
jgi:hypothetical protein